MPPLHQDFAAMDKHNTHPLELFPYFRRFRPTLARNLLYTLIWNCGLAVFFWSGALLLGHGRASLLSFVHVLFITNCIGYAIHFMLWLGERLLGDQLREGSFAVRMLFYAIVPTVGVYAGYYLSFLLLNWDGAMKWFTSMRGLGQIGISALLTSLLLGVVIALRERQLRHEAATARDRQKMAEIERQALEAQLRMLQAQIEPHFLYNTLANVVGLIGPKPDLARTMLERLIDYLRATLSASRSGKGTLDDELRTIEAYVDLLKVRMGERLHAHFEIDPALYTLPLAPMLLQPLVENAIQHGLEPKIEGGSLLIRAGLDEQGIQLEVSDSGIGFQSGNPRRPGSGVGLANLRERLAALYGPQASLSINENQPCGVRALIRLPASALATQ